MSRFWQVLSLILVAVFAGFAAVCAAYPMHSKYFNSPAWVAFVVLVLAMTLVAALWALLFRRQLERRRVGSAAIILLLFMEGCFVGMAWVLNPALLPWLQRATP